MATFFTSDTHFGDMRVLRIDKRPFKSLAEHDAALMANWNAAVGPFGEAVAALLERLSVDEGSGPRVI